MQLTTSVKVVFKSIIYHRQDKIINKYYYWRLFKCIILWWI